MLSCHLAEEEVYSLVLNFYRFVTTLCFVQNDSLSALSVETTSIKKFRRGELRSPRRNEVSLKQ